jgi:hypothetical protein
MRLVARRPEMYSLTYSASAYVFDGLDGLGY